MYVIGLTAFGHDSTAALVRDGELLALAEELLPDRVPAVSQALAVLAEARVLAGYAAEALVAAHEAVYSSLLAPRGQIRNPAASRSA